MKVLFLQDHFSTGGAARAASRFAAGLRQKGVEVAVAAGDEGGGQNDYPVTGKPARGWGRVRELFFSGHFQRTRRQQTAERSWEAALRDYRPDLIWIHNIQGAWKWGWSPRMVQQAMSAAPVLWTLHDMWALGDGPAYFPVDELRIRWNRSPLAHLQSAKRPEKFMLLTPSVWLRNLVRSVTDSRCEVWPNPLDLKTFHPRPREKTRHQLGLKEEDILLLTVAENLEDPRKGIEVLARAWKKIREKSRVRLGLLGRNCPPGLIKDPQVMAFGAVGEERRVAELMAAADLLVHPAKVESHGLVLEESQACGTPVLAAAGSGMDEAMGPGSVGWRIADMAEEGLVSCLGQILQEPGHLRALRPTAREAMEKKHSAEKFSMHWARVLESVGKPEKPEPELE